MAKLIGEYELECGLCNATLQVPIHAELVTDEKSEEDGTLRVIAYPDVSEVWMHGWTEHSEKFNDKSD